MSGWVKPTRPNDTTALACWNNDTQSFIVATTFWDDIWAVFWTFTAVFAGIALLLSLFSRCILPKDPAFCRLLSIATLFCMWLMWACVYLAQVSPLIRPKFRVAE